MNYFTNKIFLIIIQITNERRSLIYLMRIFTFTWKVIGKVLSGFSNNHFFTAA